MCLKTPYRNEMTAVQVIKKSERSEIRHKRKSMIRKSYKCPDCGFFHIVKHRA